MPEVNNADFSPCVVEMTNLFRAVISKEAQLRNLHKLKKKNDTTT